MPKRDEIGREREKKNLLPNFVHSRPRQENSEKNSKKIEKIKKTSFRHYFLPKRDEIGREREKKKFTSEFRSSTTEARKFQKIIVKKFKKFRNLFPTLFLAKTVRQAEKEKKKFTSEFRSNPTRARKF